MKMHTASGRSLWPPLVAAVLVLGVLVAFLITRSGTQATAGRAPSTAPTTSAPTNTTRATTAPVDTGAAPTGCLGGSGRDLAMVLATQKKAPHTAFGAVEFAASFYRWVIQYPVPSTADVTAATSQLVASTAPVEVKNLAGAYQAAGSKLADGVPATTPFFLSTRNGKWLVDETSTNDSVTVHIAASYVINGAVTSGDGLFESFVVVWENGTWRLQRAASANVDAVTTGGTYFTGGC